jgi:hypothetical protein
VLWVRSSFFNVKKKYLGVANVFSSRKKIKTVWELIQCDLVALKYSNTTQMMGKNVI